MCRKVVSFSLLIALFSSSVFAQEITPIKIGAILILTGTGSSWGVAAKNGVDLAIEEINGKGGLLGRPVVAVYEDDQGQAKNTVAAFRRLTEVEKIRIIIGPNWSTLGLPLIDLADRKKVLMLSPTLGMAKFNESSRYLFNTWPHDYILSEHLAEYVLNKGHKVVALVGAEDAWVKEQTSAFRSRFEQLGGRVAYSTEPLPQARDLRTEALQISRVKDLTAFVSTTDGIIVGSLLAKSLRELKSDIRAYSITLDQAAIDASQGGFEGLEFLTFLTPTGEFRELYEKRYKTSIDIGADSAYDAVKLIATAIEATKSTDSEILADYLAQVKSYPGASGSLVSDGKRGFIKPYAVMKVLNGKAVMMDWGREKD